MNVMPWLIRCLFIVSCSLSASLASQTEWQEGKHYLVIPIPMGVASATDPVNVAEVFNYACPHCRDFEPLVLKWQTKLDPSRVNFQRVHLAFNSALENLTRAFITAEELNVEPTITEAMYTAIHDHRLRMQRVDLIRRMFVGNTTVDAEAFDETFSSEKVKEELLSSYAKARAWRIEGTPTMVVDGMYKTSTSQAGSHADVLRVVDFLIEKRLKERN